MKQNRHERILELIKEKDIRTQDELLLELKKSGFNVTQATVSRDIKALRLVKTLAGNGEYIYSGENSDQGDFTGKFDTLLVDSAVKINYVSHEVVIKCYSGLANALCAAMDETKIDGLVGTVAGDDTILAIMRSEQYAKNLYDSLKGKIQ